MDPSGNEKEPGTAPREVAKLSGWIRSNQCCLISDMSTTTGSTTLGLPVIWLCRKDALAQVHFDNRQYNFILWTEDNLGDLERALKNRIKATIGRGPLETASET